MGKRSDSLRQLYYKGGPSLHGRRLGAESKAECQVALEWDGCLQHSVPLTGSGRLVQRPGVCGTATLHLELVLSHAVYS